jgi:soluble lytic murein transglycosylase-like protein
MRNNKVMYKPYLSLYFLSQLLATSNVQADVLVDLAPFDEISISNTQQSLSFTYKIAEPSEKKESLDSFAELAPDNSQANIGYSKLPYNIEVLAAAKLAALEPALIHAVIATESRHNAHAKSNKGAYGLMQLMPATARRFNVRNKNDAGQNILAGSLYLRELLNLFDGDLKLSLAAYNAGPAAVQKYKNRIPPYQETMHYVPKVLKYYKQYS